MSLVTASLSLFGQAGRSCDTDLDCETTDETGRMGSCTCKARCIHLDVWRSTEARPSRRGGTKMIPSIACLWRETIRGIRKH